MKKTPLNSLHKELGAKMTDFGGWEMPVEYEGIIEEHNNVRNNCGLFDISHMGEIIITGEGAAQYCDYLLTNSVEDMEIGKVVYSPMCYEDGGVVDDLMIYRLDEKKFMLVVNAANTDKDHEWIVDNAPAEKVDINNATDEFGLLALQGPEAENILQTETKYDLTQLKPFQCDRTEIAGVEMIFSRTGYTGEDGFELYLPLENIEEVWQSLMDAGKKYDIMPIGLGARDTLRLEKTLCLYGHELSPDIHPLMANLGWTVDFNKDDFLGKEALEEYQQEGYSQELAGFIMQERGIARKGYTLEKNGQEVGEVTSGSFSPTLEENIGLCYIDREYAEPGKEIDVIVRGRSIRAEIVETPFV